MLHRKLKSSFKVLCLLILLFSFHTIAHSSTNAHPFNVVGNYDQSITPSKSDIITALNALADPVSDGKSDSIFSPTIPYGTKVLDLQQDSDKLIIDLSSEILNGGLSEERLTAIFQQFRFALEKFGIDGNIAISTGGHLLSDYLPPIQRVAASASSQKTTQGQYSLQSTGKLSGHSVTVSPGHGIYWNGSMWTTQRGVTGYPLTEEDFHVLDICQYLETYLNNEGMTVRMVRCSDKNYGNSSYGYPWWKMASPYWLKYQGYPDYVYASYDSATLGTGWNEMSNDIRARPLASDYNGSDIYVSVHTNAYQGDVATGGPSGTESYYDSSSEHANYGTSSQTLATYITTSIIDMIDSHYDSTWTSHGQAVKDSNGAYGEIRIPQRPAMLLELGFHDTDDRDAVYLRDNFFRSVSMWAMYKGICDYFGVSPTWGLYSCEYVSDTIPATMNPGQQCQVSITMKNRGVLWTEAKQIRLGAVGESDPLAGQTRQTITGEVGPNDTYTFTFTLTAPSTAGSYVTDWRMVRDSYTWFGPTIAKTVTVGVDNAAPIISNVHVENVQAGSAQIKWTTAEASTSQVDYGLTSGYGSTTTEDAAQTTSHVVQLIGLSPNTTYHYRVRSYDYSRNAVVSGDYAFTTAAFVAPQDIVIDNSDSGCTTYPSGEWTTGTSAANKYGSNYFWASTGTSTGAYSTWTPSITVPGYYDVYCWYCNGTNRTTQARWATTYMGGSTEVRLNEQGNGGKWNLIGAALPFDIGTAGYVRTYANTGDTTSMVTVADAVKFVYVNTFAPKVAITSPTANPAYSTSTGTINLAGTATNVAGIASVSWANDRGGSGTCSGTTSWSASNIILQPGANVITVTASDSSGNRGAGTITVTLTDGSKPTISITTPSANPYSTQTAKLSLAGTSTDNIGVISVSWSNSRGGSGTCAGTSSWSATGISLQPGQNTITATATDAAGNKGTATLTVAFTDVTPPVIKITVPTTAATYTTNDTSVTLKGFATDNVGVTSPTWANNRGGSGTSTMVNGTWTSSKIALMPGANVLTVTETDSSGNKATATITVTFTDVTAPIIRITVPTTAATYATTTQALILRGFTSDNVGVTSPTWSSDRGGNGTCTIDRGTWASSKITLQPGANILKVTETDAAGNKATASVTVTYTDVTLPVIKITVPTTASGYTTAATSVILKGFTSDNVGVTTPTWASSRGGSGVCTIVNGTWTSSKIALLPGANVLTVTETDLAGNKATATITVTFTDVTQPVIKITVPTTASTYTSNASSVILKGFTTDNVGVTSPAWTNNRGGSGICTIVNGTWASSKITLLNGVNVLTVTETDAAGNKGTATITVTFTQPAKYYVSTTGNDANPGSLSKPWRTIGHGVATIAAGDTLYVRGGTYAERVDISGKSGSSSAWYTVMNYPGETPIMDVGYNDNLSVAMKFVNSSYWHVEGFCIRNYTGAGVWVADRSSYIEVFRNNMYNFNEPQIQGSGVEAILIAGDTIGQTPPSHTTIKGNCMSNVGLKFNTANDHGIYLGYGANNISMDSNRIYSCSGAGIQMYGTTGASNCTVSNNVIYNNNTWGLVMWDNGTGNIVRNNTFYNNPCDVDINEGASGAFFQNNIFGSDIAEYLIVLRDTASNNNVFDNNCYFSGNGYPIYRQGAWKTLSEFKSYGQEANGKAGNPAFQDAENGDFRLASGSVCNGAGTASNFPQYDFAGTLRETAFPSDIGAYNYDYTYDPFDGQAKNVYTTYGGTWSLLGSPEYAYQQTTYSGSAKTSVFYDFPAAADGTPTNWPSNKYWTNYSVDADVQMTGGGPNYSVGLVTRTSSNGDTYYAAIIYPNRVELWKVVSGIRSRLMTSAGTYIRNTSYHLTLACSGSVITVAVNGQNKISATDVSISAGYPGMYTDYCGSYDNFKVSPL